MIDKERKLRSVNIISQPFKPFRIIRHGLLSKSLYINTQ